MTAGSVALAERLTSRLAAVDGVRAIFPERTPAAAVLALVTGGPSSGGRVQVDATDDALRISVRLATARSVPARAVIAGAVAAVDDVVGDRSYRLELELALID